MTNFNKEIFAKNLNKYLRLSSKTQVTLAHDLGYSKSIVSEWFSGKKFPRIDAIQKLADYFGIEKSDLIEDKSTVGYSEGVKIPLLGKVQCGEPLNFLDEFIGYEEITQTMAKMGNLFALNAKGDSMSPFINHGDLLIVLSQNHANNGDIVIVQINGDEATCKKLNISENGIMLMPINSNYEPIYYSKSEITNLPVIIVGKVLEIKRKLY